MTPTYAPELVTPSHAGWPENLILIQLPGGHYAANNITPLPAEDGFVVNGLAVHRGKDSANAYLLHHDHFTGGELVRKTYAEARAIAEAKSLDALILFRGATVVDVEYLK